MTFITALYGDRRMSREFWAKVRHEVDTGCWVWVNRTSRTGTPMHGAKVAWRFAHERLIGPLIKGSQGKRVCEEPLCVNPAHRMVERPRTCASCGQALPEDRTQPVLYGLADGKVAVGIKEKSEGPEAYSDLTPTAPPEEAAEVSQEYKLPPREGKQKWKWDELDIEPPDPSKRPEKMPTGRWEQTAAGVRMVELTGGSIWDYSSLSSRQRLAFREIPDEQKTQEPAGTFRRELDEVFDLNGD